MSGIACAFSRHLRFMKSLAALNKYFVRYKWRLLSGVFFVAVSNLFAVVSPTVVRDVLDKVQTSVAQYHKLTDVAAMGKVEADIFRLVLLNGLLLLGLALAREIIEAHGGRISLSNRDGGGLLVSLLLPQN